MLKNKWQAAQKNPDRSLKDQSIDTTSYWQSLNNLPQKSIKNIVNDKILKMDKKSCDLILSKMFMEKSK